MPSSTLVVAAAFTASSWPLLTASLPSTPSATLVILLPPLFSPPFVRETVLSPLESPVPLPFLIVTPELFMVVSPVVTLVRSFSSFASLIFSVSVPSATTPMFPSVSLSASVTPPFTLTLVFSFIFSCVPVSPLYFMPSSKVAT